jgi:hypothetical protein
MNTAMHGNWEQVLAELTQNGENLKETEFMNRVIAANSQAAQAKFFGFPESYGMTAASLMQTAVKGGAIVRAFWWGFHIEISHEELQKFLNSADPINAVIGSIGSSIPSPAAPWIALAAAFIAGALKLLRNLDKGRGVYVSMSWFAPGVFVPTTV